MLGGKPGTKGSGVPGKRVGYMPQVSTVPVKEGKLLCVCYGFFSS